MELVGKKKGVKAASPARASFDLVSLSSLPDSKVDLIAAIVHHPEDQWNPISIRLYNTGGGTLAVIPLTEEGVVALSKGLLMAKLELQMYSSDGQVLGPPIEDL